jgi:hypothetical protein
MPDRSSFLYSLYFAFISSLDPPLIFYLVVDGRGLWFLKVQNYKKNPYEALKIKGFGKVKVKPLSVLLLNLIQ